MNPESRSHGGERGERGGEGGRKEGEGEVVKAMLPDGVVPMLTASRKRICVSITRGNNIVLRQQR